MEFWDEVRKIEVLDAEIGVVVGESFEVVDRPLAGDIVRDNHLADSDPFQHGCHDIIRVNIPIQRLRLAVMWPS